MMRILELKAARVRKGLTQRDVAKKMRLGETSYTKRENGKVPFTIDEAKELKKILALSKEQAYEIFFND